MFLAAKGGSLEIVRDLIQAGVDVNAVAADGATPIFEAARGGNPLILVELRFHGADPLLPAVSYGATPLHIAAFNGHHDCVHLLVSWGADVNAPTSEGCTPLHYAAYMGRAVVVSMLLQLGADYRLRYLCTLYCLADSSARSVKSNWSIQHKNFGKLAIDYAKELVIAFEYGANITL